MGTFLIATKSFFLNLKIGKMGNFFDSNKIFLPECQNGQIGFFFYNNKIFLPESQKWIFWQLNLKMGISETTKEMGLGESQNGYLVVLDNNKKIGFRSSFTLALLFWGAY
jgi:hypothetical protein